MAGNNPLAIKIPYILMTNGGGVTEAERCEKLTRQLGIPIPATHLVQAHTFMKDHYEKYKDKPILILGGTLDNGRKVAESYGFKHAYTSLDLLAWDPSIWPFHSLSDIETASTKRTDFSQVQFAAVFVIHDPRDWALDVQILSDILRSQNGAIKQPFRTNEDVAANPNVELVFCNPDLLWRSDYPLSRFGQGAFKDAFQAVFTSVTGKPYPFVQYGKPFPATYEFATQALQRRMSQIDGVFLGDMPPVYMVGDNPESDIAGANAASWKSVLVRTGVYSPKEGSPTHTPTAEAEDVEMAVRWAFKDATGLSI